MPSLDSHRMTEPSTTTPKARASPWIPTGMGLLCAVAVAGLLWQLLYRGRAFSFDAMLYARALWGVGHGHWENSVDGLHVWATHGHFLPALLAPLTWVFPAAAVLIAAQSLSLGAVVWLTARAFERAAPSPSKAHWIGVGAALLAVLGSPLIFNPYLFDLHPGLMAVPFVTAGLLRAVEQSGFDRLAVGMMIPAIFIREEFALVVAAALVLAPERGGLDRKTLWIVAAGCAAWFLTYFFVLRPALGGTDLSIWAHLSGVMGGSPSEAPPPEGLVGAKVTLALLMLTSLGGLVLPGWRWAGACLPGAALLMASRWMPEQQLNFHYSMFVAPGLIAAGFAGLLRLKARNLEPKQWARIWALVVVVGVAGFAHGSAAPFGGRFVASHFTPTPEDTAAHAMIGQIPSNEGLAVPFAYGAPAADRLNIVLPSDFMAMSRKHKTPLSGLENVVVEPKGWRGSGRFLVEQRGFEVTDRGGMHVLLHRSAAASIRWDVVLLEAPPQPCGQPLATWPDMGLVLCGVAAARGGRVAATILRSTSKRLSDVHGPLALMLRVGDQSWEEAERLWIMGGLAPIEDLTEGLAVTAIAKDPVVGGAGDIVLLDAKGVAIPREDQTGAILEPPHLSVSWGSP